MREILGMFFSCTGMCPDTNYELGPSGIDCYLFVRSFQDFSEANRTCARDGGMLVRIDTAEEDAYINEEFFTEQAERNEFWIGLSDMEDEGVFK